MDTKELTEIARTFSDAIVAQGLTKAELVMLNAIIAEMTAHKLETTPPEVLESGDAVTVEIPHVRQTPPKPKGSSIQYDDDPSSPTYDPMPSIEIEKVPPRAVASGAIIATEGEACICKRCGRIVYTVTKPIADNCKADAFFNSFKPYGKAPAMPDRIDISNAEGRISIDCPLCGDKKKSLYLVGGNKIGMDKGDIISV